MPAFGPAFGRDADRAVAPLPRRPRLHLARSLLATPWFAAGAGIVLAAVLAVDSPAALTYGPTFPVERCPVDGCSASGQTPGQAATARPGVTLKAPGMEMGGGKVRARGRGRAFRGGVLGFQVVRQWSSGFLAMITIPGTGMPDWSLQFTFSEAHVDQVWGARWQPSGNGDGGTADGPQWHGHSGEDGGGYQVTVSATGTPQAPSGCVLNGKTCRFRWEPAAEG